MNVCDRSPQQGLFVDQPIVRQSGMLFRKPFIGHFLFSLSCRSKLVQLVRKALVRTVLEDSIPGPKNFRRKIFAPYI